MANVMGATLGLFKSMLDTAKALKDMNDAVIRNAAVIELQEKILSAQHQQTSLIEYVSELEEKVAGFETWRAEADRYELKKFGHGVARFLKPEAPGAEPSHPVCANCFEERKIKFLHQVPTNVARQNLGMGPEWRCPGCSTKI
jgi:hypothetical protein